MVVRGGMKLGLVAARGGAPTDKDLAIARYGDLVGKLDLRPASCRSWISGFFFLRRRRLQESAEPEAAAVAVSLLCPMCLQVNRALNNVVRLGSPAHGGREARALAGGSAVVSTVSATGLLAPARSGSIRVGSCAQRLAAPRIMQCEKLGDHAPAYCSFTLLERWAGPRTRASMYGVPNQASRFVLSCVVHNIGYLPFFPAIVLNWWIWPKKIPTDGVAW